MSELMAFVAGVFSGWLGLGAGLWFGRDRLLKHARAHAEQFVLLWLRGKEINAEKPRRARGIWVPFYRVGDSLRETDAAPLVCVAWGDLANAIETDDVDVVDDVTSTAAGLN